RELFKLLPWPLSLRVCVRKKKAGGGR
ncbi:hypothetical protein A2U01_0089959, partial [Trifolium medium]|nr:hypothetical protein [Trifolium medium]